MVTHPSVLPGESQGRRSLVGCRLWGRTESDTTEVTQQQQQLLHWQADSFTAEPPGKPAFFCRADPYPPGCIRWVDTQKGSLDGETKEISTLAMLPMSQALGMVNPGG